MLFLLLVGIAGSACGVTTWKGSESSYWDISSNWAGGFPQSNTTVRLNHERQTNAYTVIVSEPSITDKLWIDTYGDLPIHLRVNTSGSLQLNSMRMGFKEDDRESSFTIDGGSVWGLNPTDPAITNTAFLIGNNPNCTATMSVVNSGLLSIQGSNGLIIASSKESIGRLIVNDAAVRINDSLILGKGPGSTGEMTITGESFVSITDTLHIAKLDNGALMPTGTVFVAGGTLECGTLNVGAHGHASLTQTDGDVAVGDGGITVGLSNADGRLHLSGGTLESATFMNIGHTDSNGLLSMSNGVVNIAGAIRIGSGSRSYGQIDLTGGSISADQLIVGDAISANGTVNLYAGEVLIQGADHTALQVSNGCINLEQTLIQWANGEVTDWVNDAVNTGTLCFTNGFAPGTFSTNGFDGRIVNGHSAIYWDNLENGSQFAHSGIWVEQLSPYEVWAADYNLSNADLLTDSDSDGIDNLSEYALGGNPTNGVETGIAPTSELLPPAAFEYVFRRRADASALGLDYVLETTTNLVTGSWTTNAIVLSGISGRLDDFEYVTNQVSTALLPAQFIRLRIELE